MLDRSSLFKSSGLPDSFGVVFLIFVFILLLAPYFSDADFGVFKIPTFTSPAKQWLKVIGPILFILCIVCFLPLVQGSNIGEAMCPEIGGIWKRESDGFTMKLVQSGCSVTSEEVEYNIKLPKDRTFSGKFSDEVEYGIKEHLEGKYIKSEGYFEFVVERTEVEHTEAKKACQEKLYGRLVAISNYQIKTVLYAKAGECNAWVGNEPSLYARQ